MNKLTSIFKLKTIKNFKILHNIIMMKETTKQIKRMTLKINNRKTIYQKRKIIMKTNKFSNNSNNIKIKKNKKYIIVVPKNKNI